MPSARPLSLAILAVNYGLDEMKSYFGGRDIGKKVIIVPEEKPLGVPVASESTAKQRTCLHPYFSPIFLLYLFLGFHSQSDALGTNNLYVSANSYIRIRNRPHLFSIYSDLTINRI